MTSTAISEPTVPTDNRPAGRPPISVLLLMAGWVATVVVVATVDGFVADPSLPPWPILLAVAIPIGVFLAGLRVPSIRRTVLGADPRLWLAVQLWRVVGAAFLFGWAGGDLDGAFAVPAGVGDIATGLAALWLLSRVVADAVSHRHLVAFTALGVGDFAVAVVTGALFRPDGLETLPWVLFPTLAVPFFLVVHIVNWMQLRQPSGRT